MNIVAELEAVLKEEQHLLLNGKLGALQELVDRKSRLSEWLARERPEVPAETYQRLSRRVEQNKALLEAAQRGLQAAMAQLKQTANAVDQTTYSRSGDRMPLSRRRSSIAQKV